MVTKEAIIRQLKETSVQIGERMDVVCDQEIGDIAEELAIAYSQLLKIINENKSKVSDNDFLAATTLWTACNTILAGLDLFRRGYSIEHLMLLRNSLEIMASAYVIHVDNKKYIVMRDTPDKFDSTGSIAEAKKVVPLIGPMYGMLSGHFTHVSAFHVIPHKSDTPFCIGGIYDPKNQSCNPLILSMFITVSEFVNSFIETMFTDHVDKMRFWKSTGGGLLQYSPIQEVRDRQESLMKKIGDSLKSL
ncbi:MAG: hypothetical protein WC582_00850 [Patescibacteria group bacterium]|jgi:hypothetical protein